jgi:two-component system sensor histidine kinase YesM
VKKLLERSFRARLFAGFLAASLIPLALCSAMLLQIFRLRMTASAEAAAQEQAQTVLAAMDELFNGLDRAAQALQGSALLSVALTNGGGQDTQVYDLLFSATGAWRTYARFDLYDADGTWRYSTQQPPADTHLSTDWGVLYAAAHGGGSLAFTVCEDVTDTSEPRLRGAVPLAGPTGRRVGYLVVSLEESGLDALLAGKYGSQNDLILLSPYWRPVYCGQPALAASLAPVLRARLLAGEGLDQVSEDFAYTVARHARSGLYLVIQRPQVFTQDTMRLLSTVSLTIAGLGIVLSVLLSLRLSRQLYQPIRQLQEGFGEVERNHLDVRLPAAQEDELGQLARRFNGMVAALKRNQEQMVDNQRELNQAQIRMLQAQLNPHFLCNTLDTMKWISKINRVPQVALMSTDLADILRFCISPEELVPLAREAEILGRYVEIQQVRLSGALDFRLDLPDDLADCLVPKMILQPIVENAILHGLEGMDHGSIQVEARGADGMLRLLVTDNGRGLPPDLPCGRYHREEGERRGRLGLYNVDTILTKYYGGDCGLYLDNGPGGRGAVVTAVLPIRRKEGAPC